MSALGGKEYEPVLRARKKILGWTSPLKKSILGSGTYTSRIGQITNEIRWFFEFFEDPDKNWEFCNLW